jgi:hypothetical protein
MMKNKNLFFFTLFAGLLLSALPVGAQGAGPDAAPVFESDLDYAQVVFVRVTGNAGQGLRIDVTVRHDDQGWDHYADAWQVLDAAGGKILAERVLAHPHTSEQPFTRSLSGVVLPPGTRRVRVRARCNVHDFGGREILVDLEKTRGEGYEILR